MAPLQGKRIFITGGAGFIGSRLTRALANAGASVVIFDNLLEQVHGPQPQLDLAGVLIKGDVRDAAALSTAVQQARPDIVYHLAAETGTGQSADEPSRYAAVNVVGCANLIEALKALETPPQRVILAATRAVYGEGAYVDAEGRTAAPEPRSVESMANGVFDLFDDQNRPLTPAPTRKPPPAPRICVRLDEADAGIPAAADARAVGRRHTPAPERLWSRSVPAKPLHRRAVDLLPAGDGGPHP